MQDLQEDSKAEVKAYDCQRKKTERKDLKLLKENEAYCSDRFSFILYKANRRCDKLMIDNTELEIELSALISKNDELDKALAEKEISLRYWKGKYKLLFEAHKGCKA